MTEEWLSGNKGEWSEFYVFLKVLGDGRIYGADGNIDKKPNVYFDVNKVIRHESSEIIDYVRAPEEQSIKIMENNEETATVLISKIIEEYRRLFGEIIRGKGSFPIPDTEEFMHVLKCSKIKASSADKTDITVEIREPKTGMNLVQGFSIKSMLGHPSTLVNASFSTNFIFSLDGGMNSEMAEKANGYFQGTSKSKVMDGLAYLKLNGINLRFSDTQNKTLGNNLTLIDSNLPELVGEMLKLHYQDGISKITDQIDILNKRNPLKYRNPDETPYYSFKIKKLLVSYALGMQSSKVWNGTEDANGGYIVVKDDGDVLCYHIFDRGSFEEYLINNTKLETPSTSKHDFAYVYKTDGEFKIKLNLQVRFV